MPGAYVYPRLLAGMGLSVVLFPLDLHYRYRVYSTTVSAHLNQLTFERAQQVLMDRSFLAGKVR